MRYLVSGYCMVPMKAEAVVEAETPEQALKTAKARWKEDPRSLIVSGSDDEGAACDWRPSVQSESE
jgi:hypothetical protein